MTRTRPPIGLSKMHLLKNILRSFRFDTLYKSLESEEVKSFLQSSYQIKSYKTQLERYKNKYSIHLFQGDYTFLKIQEKNGFLQLSVLLPLALEGSSRSFSRDEVLAGISERISDESIIGSPVIQPGGLAGPVFFCQLTISWFTGKAGLLRILKEVLKEFHGPILQEIKDYNQELGDQEALDNEMSDPDPDPEDDYETP